MRLQDMENYRRAVQVRQAEIIDEDIDRATKWMQDNPDASAMEQHAFTLDLLIDRLSVLRDEVRKARPEYDSVEASANWSVAQSTMEAIEGAMHDTALEALRTAIVRMEGAEEN